MPGCVFTCLQILKPNYLEQMGPIPSSNGSLDSPIRCAYSEPLATHFSDRCRRKVGLEKGNYNGAVCLHSLPSLHADVWTYLLQVHTRLVVTQDFKRL